MKRTFKTEGEKHRIPRALTTLYAHMEDGTCVEDEIFVPEIEMTDIASVVTDLMHLARWLEIDWDDVRFWSDNNYREEILEDEEDEDI